MAQPAVDLPDPLNGGDLTGVANADDLLSQLAGDEIDRLLAESEADTPPRPATTPLTSPTPEPTGVATAAESAPPRSTSTSAPAGFPESDVSPVAVPPGITATLDDVLAASSHGEPAEPRRSLSIETADTLAHPAATTAALDHDQAAAAALRGPLLHDPGTAGQRRVGLLIKPLLWMNAPVANLSASTRELMGKIAIVTMINALAVLAYVWIFVRHHH